MMPNFLELKVKRKYEDTYRFFKRHDIEQVVKKIQKLNSLELNINDAARQLGMDSISFLIMIGHLKKAGIIKEVIIR